MWAYFEGHWGEAIELYARAGDISERMGDPIRAAVANENIAEILIDQGHLERAEAFLQVRAPGRPRLGLEPRGRPRRRSCSGSARSRSGRFDEALELLDAACTGIP